MDALTFRIAKATEPEVAALLGDHFKLMRATSPAESCHVMTPETLASEGVLLIAADTSERTVGIGGLKRLSATHGELKSMHTKQDMRGSGVARALLRALVDAAGAQGLKCLSLETGTAPAFAPARHLYASEGFAPCPPFGTYRYDPLSTYMTRQI